MLITMNTMLVSKKKKSKGFRENKLFYISVNKEKTNLLWVLPPEPHSCIDPTLHFEPLDTMLTLKAWKNSRALHILAFTKSGPYITRMQ